MNSFVKNPVITIILISIVLCFSFCNKKSTPPVVTTTDVIEITQTTATAGGNVTGDGGVEVNVRGVCWNTSANPTAANSKTSDGTGKGLFTSSLTQLTPGTAYFVRAYATNSEGTSYGSQVSFTTGQIVVPSITTTTITSITSTTAVSGGSITADGGGTKTARGVCWNTSTNPTASNSRSSNGTGSGSFASSLNGLSSNTTYYVRAYATNNIGTGYGNEVDFKTGISFQSDIQPIFTVNCIACHNGVSKSPDLRDGKSYDALSSGGYIISPGETSRLYLKMTNYFEHIQRSTDEQKLEVLYWLDQGVLNN
jgi:hypothetical protein